MRDLSTEAQVIYSTLFPGAIPPVLRERFLAASQRLNEATMPADLDAYYAAIDTTGDLEALELTARLTRRLPLLTRKLRAMAYLAETLPDHQCYYVNEKSSFIQAGLLIAWQGFRSVLKAAKGFWLLRRIGHA